MGGYGSGDKTGHPFYGNQYGMGKGDTGKSGTGKGKTNDGRYDTKRGYLHGPTAPVPTTKTNPKNPTVRSMVEDYYKNTEYAWDLEHEHLYVYKNDPANVLGTTHGDGESTEWITSERPELKLHIQDADAVHNHPYGNPSLSWPDVYHAIKDNCRSITAITKEGRFWTCHRPPGGWAKIVNDAITYELSIEIAKEELRQSDWWQSLKADVDSKKIPSGEANRAWTDEIYRRAYKKLDLDIEEGEI